MPLYESVFVVRQDVPSTQVETMAATFGDIVTGMGGTVGKKEYWGLRNLAYRIKKNRKGHYALININAPATVVHEFERRLRINEDVMRFKTIRVEALDEEPSPILARRDRDERRRARREGRDGEEFGGDFDGGEE